MKNPCLASLAAVLVLLAVAKSEAADASALLWQIGKPDGGNAEFALAPNGYSQYKADGLFVVGESDPKLDWPYAHPGPQDPWAGGREHTFLVLFGLKSLPAAGQCELRINLLDTHSQGPPKLRVRVNGRAFERNLPKGAGDETVNGQPGKGKKHVLAIPFPSNLLKAGDNEVAITTLSGSWMLYDCVSLRAPAGAELAKIESRTRVEEVRAVRALVEKAGQVLQPVTVSLRHYGGDAAAVVRVEGAQPVPVELKSGTQTVEVLLPAVSAPTPRKVSVEVAGRTVATEAVTLKPVRKLTVYILPHSHTDIGYTEIQTAIEKKQVQNLVDGMAYARKTAGYPPDARFVWNVEVLWAADLYLRRLDQKQRNEFLDAVKSGRVALCGMYLNELSGLCRPEELIRLFRFATQLSKRACVPIDSVMISDVPGHTWGSVPAMNQAGIKYFSTAPNYFDRIGTILREWENKPFYWIGPDGQSKVLVWIPFWGYAMSHVYGKMSPKLVDDFCDGLEKRGYPYDIAHVRWSGHGDNAVPDPAICEFVRDWNTKYAWPHFIISGTSAAFRALEERYGDKLPRVRGDWTPYWEDGAGSSAIETGMNRDSSDRLAQAETLFAMRKPQAYPAAAFEDAWNSVLLYSEHTWGADCSVSLPESQKTREQWEIKQGYARQADRQSRALLAQAIAAPGATAAAPAASAPATVDVVNTLSWPRSGVVLVPDAIASRGDRVTDDSGKPAPSQRLANGELVFLAKDVPALAAKRFIISPGAAFAEGKAAAEGAVLSNGVLRVRVDEKTGGIVELTAAGIDGNFADTAGGESLNDYRYLPGDDLKDLKRNGPVKISVGERGPLVASLVVESDAPGCKSLRREVMVTAGQDYVQLANVLNKARLQAKSYHAKEGKESVNFAFPFQVPGGQMLLDIPLGMIRPEADQMPSACKNWFTVGRWADVSNQDRGITWLTLDAPLVEVGAITANLLNSQTNPDVWRKKVEPTQTLYSWAMNNHWGTNYRAYQDGPTRFRFVLRPHRKADPAEASRFAMGFGQPLLAVPGAGAKPAGTPLLTVEPADVLVSGLKPSDDGKAWIVRLFNAGSQSRSAAIHWGERQPRAVFQSDTSEAPLREAAGPVTLPPQGLATLRAELSP
jgi:alpha-mannosidase